MEIYFSLFLPGGVTKTLHIIYKTHGKKIPKGRKKANGRDFRTKVMTS